MENCNQNQYEILIWDRFRTPIFFKNWLIDFSIKYRMFQFFFPVRFHSSLLVSRRDSIKITEEKELFPGQIKPIGIIFTNSGNNINHIKTNMINIIKITIIITRKNRPGDGWRDSVMLGANVNYFIFSHWNKNFYLFFHKVQD